MPSPTAHRLWLAAAALAGCEPAPAPTALTPPTPPSVVMGQEPAAPRASRHEPDVSPADLDEVQRGLGPLVARFGAGYARASRAAARAIEASQTQRLALPVEGGYCYRVLVTGTASLGDLDVALFQESGAEIESDASYGVASLLGLRQPLCVSVAATLRLEVHALGGAGVYGVEVLRAAEAGASSWPHWGQLR